MKFRNKIYPAFRFPFSIDLSVSSSSWGLGRAAVCDCSTPWTFFLLFLLTFICCEKVTRRLYLGLLFCIQYTVSYIVIH